MTDWSIWPATNGPNTDSGDSSDISRGISFQLSAPGWLKAIRMYRGNTNVGNPTTGSVVGRLYNATTSVPISGTDVTFTLSGTGWLQANIAVPVALSSGVLYKAVVLSGNYTATGHYFDTGPGVGGITQGIITCPDAGGNPLGIGGIQQGSFKQPTTGLEFPNQYFQGGNYWVDVVIADTDPGSDIRDVAGSVAVTAAVTATQDGKIGLDEVALPVTAQITAGGVLKSNDYATLVPAAATVTAGDVMAVTDAVGSVIATATLTALVEAVGAGVHAPTSEVLCSAWANYVDVPASLLARIPALTQAEWQDNLTLASELLWMLSGRRWIGPGCVETATLRSWPPMQGRGQWPYDPSWGRCRCWVDSVNVVDVPFTHHRSTLGVYAIQLPRSPITNVVSVTIDGQPFTGYQMLRNGWIERTDGGTWEVCSGNTEVTYQFGEPPPFGGKRAAIALAFEIGLEQTGDEACRLPSNVVSVTRQGLTYQMQSAAELQDLYRTGVPEVDRWLMAVNPQGRPAMSEVWSPDIPSTLRNQP